MNSKLCIFLLTLVTVSSSRNIKVHVENELLSKSIALVTRDLTSIKNDGTQYLLFMNYNESSHKAKFFFNDILREISHEAFKRTALKVLVQQKKLFAKVKHREVILLQDMNSFRNLFQFMYRLGNMNLSFTVLFILSINTYDPVLLRLLFSDLYRMSILNVALIIELEKRGDIIMVTYFPFSPMACRSVQPVIINTFDRIKQIWRHTNYFPQKLKNLHGCPLVCATWDEMPYLATTVDKRTKIVKEYRGFEGKLLEFAAINLNFTTKYFEIPLTDREIGFSEMEQRLGRILANNADFAVGAFFYNPDRSHLPFTQTMHYYISEISIICNVLAHYSAYEKLIYPFQTEVWTTVGLMFALSFMLILSLSCSKRMHKCRIIILGIAKGTPYYNLFSSAMGGALPTEQLPRFNFSRFLFMCWIVITMVLRIAYQSAMYDMLRSNKQRDPPKNIEDLVAQKYRILNIGNNSDTLNTYSLTNMSAITQALPDQFRLLVKSKTRRALVAPYEYYGYLLNVNASSLYTLHLVNEKIFSQPLVMNVRRQSYLFHAFNDQIQKAKYYGFVQKWEREYFGIHSSNGKNIVGPRENDVLTMNELGAVFMILVYLNSLACLVLAIEILWEKCCKSGSQLQNVI